MIKVILVSRYGSQTEVWLPQVPSVGEEIVTERTIDYLTSVEVVDKVRWFAPREIIEGQFIFTGEVWAEVWLK